MMDPEMMKFLKDRISLFSKVFSSNNVYVAGGCLRDLDNDKAINDIDVFISCDQNLQLQAKQAKSQLNRGFSYAGDLERIFKTEVNCLVKKYGQQWPSGLQIIDIQEIKANPFKIQTILYKHPGSRGPRKLLDYFDINLCRISFDGRAVYRTDEYKQDVENRTITVDPFFIGNERTQKRVEKLKRKFEGWTVPEVTAHEQPVIHAAVNSTYTTMTWTQMGTGEWLWNTANSR